MENNTELKEYNSIFEIFNISQLKWIRVNILTIVFLSLFTSTLSIFGSIGLFNLLHNSLVIGILIGVSFEIGQILSLITYGTLAKQNKPLILSIIILLTGMQILANINTSWFYVSNALSSLDVNYLTKTIINTSDTQLIAMVDFFNYNQEWKINEWASRIVVFLFSGSLPVISLMYVKSLINYFSYNPQTSKPETLIEKPSVEKSENFLFDTEIENKTAVKPLFGSTVEENPEIDVVKQKSKKKELKVKPLLNPETSSVNKEVKPEEATENLPLSNVYQDVVPNNKVRVRVIDEENKSHIEEDEKHKIQPTF